MSAHAASSRPLFSRSTSSPRVLAALFVVGAVFTGLTFAATPVKPKTAPSAVKPATVAPAVAPVASQGEQEIGHRHALVIGNANYKNVATLLNPINDSQDICEALKKLRFSATCLYDLPDRRSMRDAVSNFVRKLKPEDSALFYFAGHGIEVDGENYLIPTEANLRSKAYVEDEALRVSFIFDELRDANVRLSIIVLDACRNNPFARVRSIAGTGLSIPSTVPAGSILIYPTAPGKTALDGDGRNGLFTTHLLAHINTGGITIEEMFKRVISGVRNESMKLGQEQVPWINLSFTGEFCFVGCGVRINTEQYQALVKQKEEVERSTRSLQAELQARQQEADQFRQRMLVLEKMLDEQNRKTNLSASELEKLNREKEELAKKAVQMREQEAELNRVRGQIARLESQQAEFAKREKEIAAANERISFLERQIKLQEERRIVLKGDEIDAIRKERDELLKKNQDFLRLEEELKASNEALAKVKATLVDYDKQKKELDEYKLRMARLEAESQQKDETLRQLRSELQSRQGELSGFRERMQELEQQLAQYRSHPKSQPEQLARLTQERDALQARARLLEEKERELKAVQQKLAQLEAQQQSALARAQDIAAQNERIAQLEAELARSQRGALGAVSGQELEKLRRERDGLKRRNEELQASRPVQASDPQLVAELQKQLQAYDRQKAELESYKRQLLEIEARLKDAATATVKGAAFVAPAL